MTDGDTLRVRDPSGAGYRVRLLGIETPETRHPGRPVECGARQAGANLRRLAPPGRSITLTTDPSQDLFDRYGRLLAYGRVGGRDIQRGQIAAGWAKVYVHRRPFERLGMYRAAERGARSARRGVWGLCRGNRLRTNARAASD